MLAQLKRPSFTTQDRPHPSYLLFSDLAKHCDAIWKFGTDHTVLEKIVKVVQLGSASSTGSECRPE